MGRVENNSKRWMSLFVASLTVLTLVVFLPQPADAAVSLDDFEYCLLNEANEVRAAAGAPALVMAWDLIPQVRDWSKWMRRNEFQHMSTNRRNDILPSSWTIWAENIAMNGLQSMSDCTPVHQQWMNSAGHRQNILNPNVKYVAIGAYVDSSGWWATQLFFDASNYSPICDGDFCDDDGSVFEASIQKIAAAGITEGCNPPVNNLFCPHDRVTRGAMAAFLSRALPLSARSGVSFVDDNGSVFESAIERIAGAGITRGCNPPSNTRFCPDDYVTRGQMAAFLARALDLTSTGKVDFVDDNNSVFESSIEKIAAAGITEGCNPPSNTRFCPDDYVTRGQMAAFLTRALGLGS